MSEISVDKWQVELLSITKQLIHNIEIFNKYHLLTRTQKAISKHSRIKGYFKKEKLELVVLSSEE